MDQTAETALFGAGCFWGVEEAYRILPGVIATTVGYCGGTAESPTYKQVCSDRTGHAEVVQVTFDPLLISYDSLLDVFWSNHDPTQMNRQGPDYGSQYRSVIFYNSDAQRLAAEASKAAMDATHRFNRTIVTSIEPAQTLWPAEDYHQKYLLKRGQSSCHI